MSTSKDTATKIMYEAEMLGWKVTVRTPTLVAITKPIQSKEDFVKADSEYYSILGLIPSTSAGSIWGTDGGGVGALAAMKSGLFEMKKSGCSKNVLKQLKGLGA